MKTKYIERHRTDASSDFIAENFNSLLFLDRIESAAKIPNIHLFPLTHTHMNIKKLRFCTIKKLRKINFKPYHH